MRVQLPRGISLFIEQPSHHHKNTRTLCHNPSRCAHLLRSFHVNQHHERWSILDRQFQNPGAPTLSCRVPVDQPCSTDYYLNHCKTDRAVVGESRYPSTPPDLGARELPASRAKECCCWWLLAARFEPSLMPASRRCQRTP